MGIIEADIARACWLFRFRPCSVQGQFTLLAEYYAGSKSAVSH